MLLKVNIGISAQLYIKIKLMWSTRSIAALLLGKIKQMNLKITSLARSCRPESYRTCMVVADIEDVLHKTAYLLIQYYYHSKASFKKETNDINV